MRIASKPNKYDGFFVVSNNAGIMATPFMLSTDNIELQFATNHIGMIIVLSDA